MAHSLIPVPQDIANAVEDYVRSELRDCARYSNRAPLDDSGVWSLRRLVERAYASGYDAGHSAGSREVRAMRDFDQMRGVVDADAVTEGSE